MKKILLLITILMATAANLLLATQIIDTIQVTSSSYPEGKFIYKDSSVIYNPSPYALGRLYNYDGDTTTVISRTYFTFNMTSKLHAGSTVNQVNVVYYTSSGLYTFKITQVANLGTDQQNYTAIGNGNVMNSGISYGSNSPTSPLVSPNIKNILPRTGNLYLGALSENETGNNTCAPVAQLTLYVIETYTAQTVTLTAENDLHGNHGGQIGVGVNVGATSRPSPYGFSATEQQTVNLQAYDNQVFGSYSSLYNDVEAPNNTSKWTKTVGGKENNYKNPQTISYSANINDNNGLFKAYLRYNYAVSRNDETEFDGTSSAGVVTHIVESNSGSVPAPSTKTVGGNNYIFAGWENGGNGVFSPTDNSLYPNPAMYKVTHKSNNASAFVNNSQRKLVQTHDGWLHQVYESMGHVWLEESTDGGSTWFLGNRGRYLDNGSGKCPSIDWGYKNLGGTGPDENIIVLAFQQISGNFYTIQYAILQNSNGTYVNQTPLLSTLYTEQSDSYSTNANPNIALGNSELGTIYNFVVTFERKNGSTAGINWIYGEMYANGVYPTSQILGPVWVNGTLSNCVNATVNMNKNLQSADYGDFDIVYEQDVASHTSSIIDVIMNCQYINNSWSYERFPSRTLSSGTGRANYKPSMVQMPDATIQVSWIRDEMGDPVNAPYDVNVVYWNEAYPSQYTGSGFKAQSVSLNVRDDNARTFYAWSDINPSGGNNLQNHLSSSSTTVPLSTQGRDVQLSNGPVDGAGNTNMYTSVFYPLTMPYYFQSAGRIGTLLRKTSGHPMTYGRGVVLGGDSLHFSYSLRSLTVDNSNIKFVEIPQTKTDTTNHVTKRNISFLQIDSLNTVLLSEPFAMNTNSNIVFSEEAGFVDTSSARTVLGTNGYVSYRLELVDVATNKSLGVIKERKFSSSNLTPCQVTTSQLNVAKVGAKTVRIKITVSSNIPDLRGALMTEYGTMDGNALAKEAVNELTFQTDVPSVYALEQNYPNPFNPSTTINYQIPKDGLVTIKIFDALGREVKMLVNEYKTTGRYSVEFDASHLSSGVYFYSVVAGEYKAVKKMLLMK